MKKWELRTKTKVLGKSRKIMPLLDHFEARIGGRKGAEEARDRFAAMLDKLYPKQQSYRVTDPKTRHEARLSAWKEKSAESLAICAGIIPDEHGPGYNASSGDYISLHGLDYVGPWESHKAPYHDMGSDGLGLVAVERTRVYARSSKWRPSSVTTYFLVGRNESGTYFSHPVSPNCKTVEEAVQWIWNGMAYKIIQRQGDIALVGASTGPKMPHRLPWGHKIKGDMIIHETHPDLPLPKNPGERIIVGRRASARARAASRD
jgi:hypothetical protein